MRLKVAMSDFDPAAEAFPAVEPVPAIAEPENRAIAADEPAASLPPACRHAAVSSAHASLTRAIGRGRCAVLPALGEEATLHLYLNSQEGNAATDTDTGWIDPMLFEGSFGVIALADGGRLVRALCGVDVGPKPDHNADDNTDNDNDARAAWLHAAILGRLHDTPLGCADRIIRAMPSLLDDTVSLRLVVRSPVHAFSMQACAAPSTWLSFLSLAAWTTELATVEGRLAVPPIIPLAIPVLLGRHDCTAQTVFDLQPGDIVLPETVNFSCSGEGVLHIAGLRVRVVYEAPRSLRIVDIVKMESKLDYSEQQQHHPVAVAGDTDWEESDAIAAEEADAAVSEEPQAHAPEHQPAFNDLPVTLDFGLGHIRVSLGELQAMGPGVVLSIESGSPASVAITSSGHSLGRGEIVDVDGQLGIRIIQWGAAS